MFDELLGLKKFADDLVNKGINDIRQLCNGTTIKGVAWSSIKQALDAASQELSSLSSEINSIKSQYEAQDQIGISTVSNRLER